jgi:hypothetical protein
MDNRQSPAINISLYTIPKNTACSVHKQPGLILPSIKDLHLPISKTVDAQTQTQTGFFQEEQNEKPTLLRAYSATTRPRKHHSNKPYTPDQIRFIQCKRDNEDMPWMRVTEEYNRAFPGYYRSRSGLEARYYREQLSEPNGNTGFAGFESTT